MDDLELMLYCDQIEKLGELAELEPSRGLDLDGLQFAAFWVNVEEPRHAVD